MGFEIKKVGIIGAGTMGAGIAAQLVNSGVPVVLLDRVTPGLSADEQNDTEARSRLTESLFQRMVTGRPVQLGRPALAEWSHEETPKMISTSWPVAIGSSKSSSNSLPRSGP